MPIPLQADARVVALRRATLREVDFRRAAFDTLLTSRCTLVDCDFRGLALGEKYQDLFSRERQGVFQGCRFDGADLRAIAPGQSRFERCSFVDARLDGWQADAAEFVDCVFGGRVVDVRFSGRPWGLEAQRLIPARATNAFSGNDFTAAALEGTVFVRGIDVDAQRWPTGPEYVRLDRWHHRIATAHAQLMRWKDLKERKQALALLAALSTLYGQQRAVFTRAGSLRTGAHPEVERRVWEILARS